MIVEVPSNSDILTKEIEHLEGACEQMKVAIAKSQYDLAATRVILDALKAQVKALPVQGELLSEKAEEGEDE